MVHPHDSFTESKRCLDLRRLKNKLESTVKKSIEQEMEPIGEVL